MLDFLGTIRIMINRIIKGMFSLWVNFLWWIGAITLDNILYRYRDKEIIVGVENGFTGYIKGNRLEDGEYEYRITIYGFYGVRIATDLKYNGNDYFGNHRINNFIGIR